MCFLQRLEGIELPRAFGLWAFDQDCVAVSKLYQWVLLAMTCLLLTSPTSYEQYQYLRKILLLLIKKMGVARAPQQPRPITAGPDVVAHVIANGRALKMSICQTLSCFFFIVLYRVVSYRIVLFAFYFQASFFKPYGTQIPGRSGAVPRWQISKNVGRSPWLECPRNVFTDLRQGYGTFHESWELQYIPVHKRTCSYVFLDKSRDYSRLWLSG